MKTSELTGVLLDYWVGKAERKTVRMEILPVNPPQVVGCVLMDGRTPVGTWSPTTIWQQGGPIIEREPFGIFEKRDGEWHAGIYQEQPGFKDVCIAYQAGPTILVAAMRAYVTSKYGAEVETT